MRACEPSWNVQVEFSWIYCEMGIPEFPCYFQLPDSVSSCEDYTLMELPAAISLGTNYPNPFNPSTVIPYELDQPLEVTLKVYDLQGNMVATSVDGVEAAGEHRAIFAVEALPSGICFYGLRVGGFSEVRKPAVVR